MVSFWSNFWLEMVLCRLNFLGNLMLQIWGTRAMALEFRLHIFFIAITKKNMFLI